ncbi:MAG: flagellar hook-basal body complex protein FliE [SAR324 cluster bacterium]|nr:flagellar hook-basal body complex protein FliE [SAR324 cluster bacterium]MCZ6558623.1 flagellar hook-basal body complex protein FliE [SAR324 cluster bacterium]MCZ6646731.1 flagellar hook-basal body complex protein FliE [SAR324 cluster bacterium]MCZ6729093.1 flagellar hook-basal body complex protein FliE [SAR324 cluster bacterium]MCZ6841280.1 flagellar hook-basal body complex protein FliE [SAR324 cluster bacterium]
MEIKVNPQLTPLIGDKNAQGQGATLIDDLSNQFSKMLNEVNTLQVAADKKIEEFATSKEKDLHGTMIAMQKADVSLRLLLQVRAKLTTAYQEIMRTQL